MELLIFETAPVKAVTLVFLTNVNYIHFSPDFSPSVFRHLTVLKGKIQIIANLKLNSID